MGSSRRKLYPVNAIPLSVTTILIVLLNKLNNNSVIIMNIKSNDYI